MPAKQTLERLASAAIVAGYPDRGPGVQTWLDAPPRGQRIAKSYAHSYFAKWHADHGDGDLYENLWRDEAIVAELRRRLESRGAWKVVQDLVDD